MSVISHHKLILSVFRTPIEISSEWIQLNCSIFAFPFELVPFSMYARRCGGVFADIVSIECNANIFH